MKSIPIVPFKHLTDGILRESGVSMEKCAFEYTDGSGIHRITADNTARDNQYYLHDSRGWAINELGMMVHFCLNVLNPSSLYALVSPGALLSIGVTISSKESNRTEAIELSELNKDGPQLITSDLNLGAGLYRNEIRFRIVVYLKERGKHIKGTASVPGTILGILHEFQVVFDKQTGLFPTEVVADPKEPLWWVVCRWSDISEDSFSKDNVVLCLNSENPGYPLINPDSPRFDDYLFVEAMSSAIMTIMMEAKTQPEWLHVINGDAAEGTIAFMLSYMINTLGWDSSSPSSLSHDIRVYMQKELKR